MYVRLLAPSFYKLAPVNSCAIAIFTAQSDARKDQQRRSAAYTFLKDVGLADEDDDPEDADENIDALLAVGFKNKQKFLTALPTCDSGTRAEIMGELKKKMGQMDFGVLLGYLKTQCGIDVS